MWQRFHARRPQRIVRRRTNLGLFACLVSVLLIGVVIGRATYRAETAEPDEIRLDSALPTRTGDLRAASEPGASPATPTPSAGAPGARDERAELVPVERTPAAAGGSGRRTASPSPSATPSRGPSNTIEGSSGGGLASLLIPGGGDGGTGRLASLASIENAVVRLVNRERRRVGCRPLRVDPRLVRAARRHSAEMAATNRLSHSSRNGATPWRRMEQAGYHHGAAENIARGYLTAEEAVRGWMAHPDHRANILNCRIVATGVGVKPGPGGPWWTQDFGYS
ncbi:hypothetical protein GCM10010106_48990 [Thermopolyspora flexuosa]|nr:CAP domain-containing protein [Thermopolyspora flexuosa]GGM94569.1 hypothetical protein GCM10010106_48990 [Thermopolyspora flexuosa]